MNDEVEIVGAEVFIEPSAVEVERVEKETVANPLAASYPWAWPMVYLDGIGQSRVMGPGFAAVPVTRFVAGYRVPNGQLGGGFPPAGATPNPREHVIRLQPPIRGSGRLTFVTQCKIHLHNVAANAVEYAFALGVAHVSGPSRPMWPYLGVSHDQDPWPAPDGNLGFERLAPGEVRRVVAFRLDIVDHNFAEAGAAWPNWEMRPHPASLLFPAVTPAIRIRGGSLKISDVFAQGWAC